MNLRRRIILAAILAALLSLVVVAFSVDATVRNMMRSHEPWTVQPRELEGCLSDPAGWSGGLLNFGEVYAYYPDGTSANPNAPPIPTDRMAALQAPEQYWARDMRGGIIRAADSGPCALFQVNARPPPMQGAVRAAIFGGAAAAALIVALFAQLFAINPLLVRIRQVRRSARSVGSDDFAHTSDGIGDALSEIADVLDQSNARIVADREELLARQQALERHLAEVAHDLRTPLASLLLALQEVRAEVGPQPALHRALGDAAYVTALIDNLHEATRLRRGADVTAGEADLGLIVERLGARFGALGQSRDISVAVAPPERPVRVRCAPSFAERALANLIHNAIDHGRAGGNVAVLLEPGGDDFTLTVMDDGPGVPEDALADLSAATFRTDMARQRSTGLGLAITNEVARRAGWTIRYSRLEPSGLQVQITGPLSEG